MHKFERYRQIGLSDFNQPFGLKMDLENRWVNKQKPFRGMLYRNVMQNCSQVKQECRQSHCGLRLEPCLFKNS